jgi:hypothetical protein
MDKTYTVRASVIYELAVVAGDEEDAIEKASMHKFNFWREVDVDLFVDEIEETGPDRVPHVDD